MTDRDECRNFSCSNDARGGGGFSGRFCSTPCELKYEHVRADAREAERDARREAREEDGL
ncbi:hypothetical protein [Halococcus sp. PRR34]|uniref:hypothetical protein n=1 Tax=Halococcus sp. PRR34 TaxID=3020830 RepID=UPI00235F61B4|nr:hypothetical protein [Halococcus sp. PRR34]